MHFLQCILFGVFCGVLYSKEKDTLWIEKSIRSIPFHDDLAEVDQDAIKYASRKSSVHNPLQYDEDDADDGFSDADMKSLKNKIVSLLDEVDYNMNPGNFRRTFANAYHGGKTSSLGDALDFGVRSERGISLGMCKRKCEGRFHKCLRGREVVKCRTLWKHCLDIC